MTTTATAPVTVLGSGSWGTALAAQMARQGHDTLIWGRDAAQVEGINARGLKPNSLLPISARELTHRDAVAG